MKNLLQNRFNFITILIGLITATLLISCKGPERGPESVLDDMYGVNSEMLAALNTVKSADDFAALLNIHVEKTSALVLKVLLLNEKYPEMASHGRIPPELENSLKRNMDLNREMMTRATPYLEKYGSDQRIIDAMKRLAAISEGRIE
jgi:hypothetical protein